MKLPELNWPLVVYLWLGCICLRAIAHSAFRILCGDDVSLAGAVLLLIVASFAGLLEVLLAMRCNWSAETTGIVCAIAGWAGGWFVCAIERRVMSEISSK